MKPFFRTMTVDEVRGLMQGIRVLGPERVDLSAALGRTLARDLVAPHDLPGFARATMDGYAVRTKDTFGASETSPAYLELAGEVLMGAPAGFAIGQGRCGRIGTGGMLPGGADAVVMVEHTRAVDERTVEVSRAVAPGANVLGPDDDARAGEVVLEAGLRLRPQDVGLLAALGVARPEVVRRPRAGIVSTGDEIVAADETPGPGRVRDVNTHSLACQVAEAGGEPAPLGLVPDDERALRKVVERSIKECNLTLLSGGSSMGQKDLTVQIFLSFPSARLLVHGVSVSPGKPFIWAEAGGHHLLGLPGQVASCAIAFHLFVEPMMERLLGREARSFTRFGRLDARLTRNVPAGPGREVYQRVRVRSTGGVWEAEPIFGKSGLLRTLTQGHGHVRVPLGCEGLEEGTTVTVLLFP